MHTMVPSAHLHSCASTRFLLTSPHLLCHTSIQSQLLLPCYPVSAEFHCLESSCGLVPNNAQPCRFSLLCASKDSQGCCPLQISLGPFTDLPTFEIQHLAQTHNGVSILGQARQVGSDWLCVSPHTLCILLMPAPNRCCKAASNRTVCLLSQAGYSKLLCVDSSAWQAAVLQRWCLLASCRIIFTFTHTAQVFKQKCMTLSGCIYLMSTAHNSGSFHVDALYRLVLIVCPVRCALLGVFT